MTNGFTFIALTAPFTATTCYHSVDWMIAGGNYNYFISDPSNFTKQMKINNKASRLTFKLLKDGLIFLLKLNKYLVILKNLL